MRGRGPAAESAPSLGARALIALAPTRPRKQTGYCNLLVAAGGRPIFMDDVSQECAKTWDICLDMLAKPELWGLAASMGTDFVAFLKSFHAMKEGFRTGAFRFTILIGEKPVLGQV